MKSENVHEFAAPIAPFHTVVRPVSVKHSAAKAKAKAILVAVRELATLNGRWPHLSPHLKCVIRGGPKQQPSTRQYKSGGLL